MSRMPQITAKQLVRFLKAQGFVEDRQSGSHLTMFNPRSGRVVTVPVHTRCDIGRGLAARILRDSGFTQEEYLRLR